MSLCSLESLLLSLCPIEFIDLISKRRRGGQNAEYHFDFMKLLPNTSGISSNFLLQSTVGSFYIGILSKSEQLKVSIVIRVIFHARSMERSKRVVLREELSSDINDERKRKKRKKKKLFYEI